MWSRWAGPLGWDCFDASGASNTPPPIGRGRGGPRRRGCEPDRRVVRRAVQRVLFARTIVRDASVILLDEPFSAVDSATEADLMAIVHAWHRQGRTVVVVLHDLELIRAEFPATLLLGADPPAWGPQTLSWPLIPGAAPAWA